MAGEDDRQARLRRALKANMGRRKAQARARRADPEETERQARADAPRRQAEGPARRGPEQEEPGDG